MRLKYYLRGLGLGILFTTLFLMISFRTREPSISDAEIIERAEKLGMVIPETQETEDTEALSVLENGGTEADTEGTAQPTDTENAEQPQEPDAQTSAEQQQPQEPQQNASESQEPGATDSGEGTPPEGGEQQMVTITTTPGETCRQIAEDLKNHGLVADAEDFRLYMFRNNYDERILQGSFTIPAGSTYEQIAAILTTRSQ